MSDQTLPSATQIGGLDADGYILRTEPVPRSNQRAVILCENLPQPTVLAVVHPRGVPIEQCRVDGRLATAQMGEDLAVVCNCGMVHDINGGRLRSELLGYTRRTFPQRIKYPSVSR